MNRERNNHSTYDANRQAPIGRTATLYCAYCSCYKPPNAFSNTQLDKAGSRHHPLRCKQCTPAQQLSLTCMICAKTKPLDGFAKAQRKNAEKARCLKCMQTREDDNPNMSEDEDGDLEEDENYIETWHDVVSHPTND
ncbi:hypothetical protein BC936DRAFT_141340 [Jimgerdemannia flammicorona]|uniref:Uncharacterized protein n=2 Tax=Jimgerdemannia flammicorona TaxID=994334 RepID=A0A433A2H5_9FUNG|nr:hypothetical protein BC936DRAFT_141340 [Jimgerdemannia flammicorona]RUS24279.1 hypothetical protein BC938DRAFT_473840 [Jimgerdemannia flammicorona]